MTIKLFDNGTLNSFIENKLTENFFEPKFSVKKKLYYTFVRPFIPLYLRQKIQNSYGKKIKYNDNFIDDSLIHHLFENGFKTLMNEFKYKSDNNSVVILTHDVEDYDGFKFIPRVIELEEKYGFKSSWNIVPYKYKIDDGIIRTIKEAGHEIGIHGYNHDGRLYYSEKIFNERAKYINEALKKYDAVGFRSPMVHRNLKWLQKLNILYDASCFDYDPFQPFPGGTGAIWPFIAGKFVELPYTLPQDHTLFYVLKVKDISIWKNKIDWLIKNKGMVLVLTHPDYLIEKRHFQKYEELLIYLKSIESAWFCLPKELATWWKNKFDN